MITVLGSHGFIGSYLTDYLMCDRDEDCYCPEKNEDITGRNLGNVICCVGLTADFRTRPLETVEAHVNYLVNFFKHCTYDSFVYLSSTRIYNIGLYTNFKFFSVQAHEDDELIVEPLKFDNIYNISKIMGESVCYCQPNTHVVRLSNVYGYDAKSENFIFTLIRDALAGQIVLHTTLDSCKDYVSIYDVVELLYQISMHGKQKVYNVASGINTTAGQITTKLKELTGCSVSVSKDAVQTRYPQISIRRIQQEFSFKPNSILDDLLSLVQTYERNINAGNR